jgi:hypothetical protein
MPYDGSPTAPPDITTWVQTHDTAYWRSHPDVVDAVSVPAPADDGEEGFELKLWLRPAPADAPSRRWERAAMPSRLPEFEIFMDGEPIPTFTDRLPALEYARLFVDDGNKDYPDGWWVARLWVSEVGRRLIAASLS